MFFVIVQVFNTFHDVCNGLCVPLSTLKLWYSAETAGANAAARRVCKIGVTHWILVVNLIENAVVGYKILDRGTLRVFRVQLFRKVVESQGNRWRPRSETLYEANTSPI